MCLTDSLHRYRLKVVAEAGGQDGRTLTQNLALLSTYLPTQIFRPCTSGQRVEQWKFGKLWIFIKAQVRLSSRGPVFSEPFYPTWDLHSSKTKKEVEAKRLSRTGGTISKLVGTENSNLFLILCFISLEAHQFVHMSNLEN